MPAAANARARGFRPIPVTSVIFRHCLHALRQPADEFEFLAGQIDASRVAISGNGDGSQYAAAASGEAGVRLIMQWDAATAVQKRGDLKAVVFISGMNDQYSPPSYASVQSAFLSTSQAIAPSLLVGVTNAGHLSMTELCNARSPLGRTGMDLSQKYRFCDLNFDLASALWPCTASQIAQSDANAIFSYATTAALEEFLSGKDQQAAWSGFKSAWGELHQLR